MLHFYQNAVLPYLFMNPYREFYHRHLPHWQPKEAVFFVTFRLKGSLPVAVMEVLREQREQEKQNLTNFPAEQRDQQDELDERRSFGRWDSALDKADYGPRWLAQPAIAEIVKEALHYRDGLEYDLFGYCIMSNHVHVVFESCKSDWQSDLPGNCQSDLQLNKIMQSLKRHTARKANLVLGRQGAFWQDESYDHVIRNAGEFKRILDYVLKNPVKAGLVSEWQAWPWSYHKPE
jgi:REP element-mobilizing transposase RayT